MAYIGREPQIGNFQVCDAISVVNGQAAYTMQVSSVNVSPETANHMIVSLNGIIQAPGTSYTVAGSTITFASNLATGDVINFIHILGSVLDLGVPSDDTVGAAQIKNDLISGTTALAVAPAATDEFLVSDAGVLKRVDASLVGRGKIGQVVQTVKTDHDSTTSTSFNDISGMSVAITPSATSSKILVFANTNTGETINYTGAIQLMRDTTALFIGDASSSRTRASAGGLMPNARTSQQRNIHYLDSPSSTSALTYKLQWLAESGGTLYLNREAGNADAVYSVMCASSITVMEVLA
jgi:hypothetical protein